MQHAAARLLEAHGLYRYEISNYAQRGFECRHNLVYWRRGEYLGLGCAAHSLMEEQRFSNTPSLSEYLSGTREVEREPLDFSDVLEETVMLNLRTAEGMDMDEYRMLCGRSFPEKKRVIKRLTHEGMARIENNRLALTERGMDVLNAVIEALV
jgi:oxygen-independent coproporphyrinogen-3 oxidase